MAIANPYDRRARPARTDSMLCIEGGPYDTVEDGRRAYPGFSLTRLEELLRDEFARGFNCGEGTHERVMEEALPDIKRKVWEEGRAAGRREVLGEFDQEYGAGAKRIHASCRVALDRFAADPKATTKAELEAALDKATDLIACLITTHHEKAVPF